MACQGWLSTDCLSGWRSWRWWVAEIEWKNCAPSACARRASPDWTLRLGSGQAHEGGCPYVICFECSTHNLPQRREQTFYLLHRVVVNQADAQEASQALYV